MKKFFVEHVDALLSVVVVTLILSLFMNFRDENGNTGILQVAGAVVDSSGQDFSENEERLALTDLASAGKPVITSSPGTYSVNVNYVLSDCIRAKDAADNDLPVKMESISRRTGEDVTYLFDENTGTIKFDIPGVYDIQIYTMDSNNKRNRSKISFAVNW